MAINEVKIPVSLQLESVGKQVADLRKLVQNGVNVDSSSYKRLNELLGQAERGLINLGQSAKKSFTSMGEVHKFETGIDKIYDKTGAVIDILKNLTFKDLKFSDAELAPIENLRSQLAEIDKQIKSINSKDFKLDKLTTEELTKNGIKVASKDSKAIQSDIEKAKKQAEAELKKYQELERKLNEIALKTNFNKEDRNILITQLGLTEDDLKDVDKVLQAAVTKVEELPKEISLKKEKINVLDTLGNEIEKSAQEQLSMMPELEAKRNALIEGIKREKEALTQAAREAMALALAQDSLKKEYQEMKTVVAASEAELQKLVNIQNKLNNVQSAVKRWFGLNEVLNLTKTTVRNVVTHIRELDDTMTEIAIVTDMTQEQLWGQVSAYSALAREYGATIKGVYEVSQLYYQQGLQTNEVMNLTEETLKMARLSNVSYKDATDYMTVAVRGFKMEMSEAQRVVDVYARIAAVSASDTQELAEAMSKTASSAEAVGASFENTTAMIALMVETTREAPQNIGSALKSLVSRFGEMTADPTKLVDSEGEAMSLNKVDKALRSVGISLQDVNGQFRNFDDVIVELSSKWDTLDRNSQRYIATVMAGNRQQSRFLALVGNYDRLVELMDEAANSEDAAAIQMLKTMDSITTKVNQLKATAQELYTSMGIEEFAKNTLDFLTQIMERINSMGKLGKFPAQALATVVSLISAIKNVAGASLKGIAKLVENKKLKFNTNIEEVRKSWDDLLQQRTVEIRMKLNEQDKAQVEAQIGAITGKPVDGTSSVVSSNGPIIHQNGIVGNKTITGASYQLVGRKKYNLDEATYQKVLAYDPKKDSNKTFVDSKGVKIDAHDLKTGKIVQNFKTEALNTEVLETNTTQTNNLLQKSLTWMGNNRQILGTIAQGLGSVITLLGIGIKTNSNSTVEGGKVTTGIGQLISGAGYMTMGPMGWVMGIISILTGVASLADGLIIDTEERIELLKEEQAEAEERALKSRAEANNMDSSLKKYERLRESSSNSEEDYQAFINFQNELATQHSELISYYDEEGNAIIDINEAYSTLLSLRHQEHEDAIKEIEAEQKLRRAGLENAENFLNNSMDSAVQDTQALSPEAFDIQTDAFITEAEGSLLKDGWTTKLTKAQVTIYRDYIKKLLTDNGYDSEGAELYLKRLSKRAENKDYNYENEFAIADVLSLEDPKNLTEEQQSIFIEHLKGYTKSLGSNELSLLGLTLEDIDFDENDFDAALSVAKRIQKASEDVRQSIEVGKQQLLREKAQLKLTSAEAESALIYNGVNGSTMLELQNSPLAIALAQNEELTASDVVDKIYGGDFTSTQRERIDKILGSVDQYSSIDNWVADLEKAGLSSDFINDYLNEYLNTLFEINTRAQERLDNFISNSEKNLEGVSSLEISSENFNAEQIEKIMNQWGSLVNETFADGLKVRSEFYANQLNALYEKGLENNELMDVILSSDLTTGEGLRAAKEAAKEAGAGEDVLAIFDIMLSNLFLNANTAVETYISELKGTAEKVKNAGELYSKGTTDLEEMANIRSLLSQEGFEGTVFEWDEAQEAFMLTTEAYQKWREMQEEQATQLREDAEAILANSKVASQSLSKIESSWKGEAVSGTLNGLSIEASLAGEISLADAYEAIQKQWETYLATNEDATWGDFINQWNGDLEALAEGLKLSAEEAEQLLDLYSPIRQASNITSLSEYFSSKDIFGWGVADTAGVLKSENLSLGEKQHAIKVIEDAQNTLFDILATGQDATEAQIVEWSLALGQESTELVEKIINGELTLEKASLELGFDIDTSTQAYADAYNAWLENTTGSLTDSAIALLEMEEGQMISQEFVDKLRSKYPEVADAILESFFPDGIFNGNTLGLAAEFKKHGDFKMQDAGQQVIDSYASMISRGIEGSLSHEDYGKLISQFDQNINYEFTEGEKGLKLSLSTANELYAELLKIDSIAAGTVMDSMVEEYKSWYDGALDVGTVLRKIEETREKISSEEAKNDPTKKKQYEAELKVLNEIYARRIAEDFAFMDRDMGDLNNPLTYWENVQQAADSMYEAANSGYMGVQDFYSIMSHTQDMLIAAGMDTEIAGKECSQLILEGFRAMTSVDGEMVVPLESLGQNFVNGADGMYANFQDGIQTLAKSQIELLDAQIAMLEAVVAMEEMDFGDNGIDQSDFFQWSGTRYKFTDQWKEASDAILANLSQGEIDVENTLVLIGDELISLADLFSEEKIQELINNSEFRENYTKFMELLYSFIDENGQFDLDAYQTWADSYLTPLNTMKEKLEKLGDGGTVDFSIGGITYTVTKNEDTYTITTEDGEVVTDGSLEGALTKLGEAQETESEEKLAEYYESKAEAKETKIELPMSVMISPKIEKVTWSIPKTNNLALDKDGNLLNPATMYQEASGGTSLIEVPYNLDFNVNVVSENVPDALFEVLETGSGEYDITFKSSEENLALLAGLNDEIEEMSDLIATPIELISLENLDLANLFIYELIENLKKLGTINPNVEIESAKTTVSPTTGITGELPTLAAPSSTYDPEGIFNPIKLEFEQAAEDINNNLNIQPAVDSSAAAGKAVNDFSAKLKGLSFASAIYNVSLFANAIAKIPARQTIDIVLNITSTSGGATDDITRAAGTVNLSHTNGASRRITITTGGGEAKGTVALSRGTLMGELGPELVVSNGRYFVVGQNGAEFVNLADDAIVFNHLQTRQLLNNGNTSHGRPVKNERASVGMAAGNVDGPAKASAKETLDQLYQLRAMWEAMLTWSTKDLASMAGSGGGGGGGGGGEGEEKTAFLAELEKWYNLLRQIAKWEEKITLEQARRQNMLSGYDYVNSLEKELDMLKKQEKAHRDLAVARGDYYKQLRNDFLGTEFAKIFTYDSDGLMQYTEEGFKILRDVLATNADGIAQFTAEEQIKELEQRGIDMSSFWINDDLSTAKDANQALQNFFDREARVREQMDAAYDSYHDELIAIEETISAQTELEQEYIDTQLSFEDKLYQALEDKLQAQIDALEDEKEALENASQSYIDGLNEALSNERNMYSKNQSKQETEQLQRRLAILERSGGSQSEINSLREQIDARLQDSYFEAAQEQIDAVQKAANAQIERLDEQINIMTDALEYQKENGLLWQEVYKMMAQWTPSQLMDFIEEYTQSMKENSPLQNQEDLKEALKEAEILDGKKRREEGEKSWGAYYSSAQGQSTLAGLSDEEIEKVKQAYIEDIVKGGSGVSAAVKEKNNILNQKAQDEAAGNAGGSSSGGSTVVKGGPASNITMLKTGSTEVYKTPQKSADNVISYINGPLDIVEYDPTTGWFKIKNWTNQSGVRVGDKIGYYKVHSDKAEFSNYTDAFKKYLSHFKSGGLIDFTGPAWVDGTKSKPESILSAEDTALLRSRIFSDSEYSLRSAIEALRELRTNWRNIISSEYGGGVSIDNVEINFNSGTISSDYDMRRAADVAFEELRNLARKTTGVSLNRR